jgi:hypothetical protein
MVIAAKKRGRPPLVSTVKSVQVNVPHDWTYVNWPASVFPYEGTKARHVVRQNQAELLKYGALTRIGKHIVIFGAEYCRWLAAKAHRVTEFDVPANRPQHQHKRFGGIHGEPADDAA